MHKKIDPKVKTIVLRLQEAGYETYVVGGAVRDTLLQQKPKDYDVSTAATPEEIRAIFGRKRSIIIGKRFRLVHIRDGRKVTEVSTFRRQPKGVQITPSQGSANEPSSPHIIYNDNEYGTPFEDAFRRDFTVNALFYDPVKDEIKDFTQKGIDDLNQKIVRVIGDPTTRFEEDPVRMLRALKLVGQFGFNMEVETATALVRNLSLITLVSPSRLALELEKILRSPYGDQIFKTFREYGLLKYFMPWFDIHWDTEACHYAMDLLRTRNQRIQKGHYRESLSIALACITLPFIESEHNQVPGSLWEEELHPYHDVWKKIKSVMYPHNFCQKVIDSATAIIMSTPDFLDQNSNPSELMCMRSYAHTREFFIIQNEVAWLIEGADARFPKIKTSDDENEAGVVFPHHGNGRSQRFTKKSGKFGKKQSRYPHKIPDSDS